MERTHNTEDPHGGEVYNRVALLAEASDLALIAYTAIPRERMKNPNGPKQSYEGEADDPVSEEPEVLGGQVSARRSHIGAATDIVAFPVRYAAVLVIYGVVNE